MSDDLNEALQGIKKISGVENVALIQQDGIPVGSAGVWFSKEDVFAIASATSCLNGVIRQLHDEFKYFLMESDTSKVFLTPVQNLEGYFLTITTAPRVNLAALFIEMKEDIRRLANVIQGHIDGRFPPLRSYSTDATMAVAAQSSASRSSIAEYGIPRPKISLDRSQALSLRALLRQVSDSIPNVDAAYLSLSGGFQISQEDFTGIRQAAMVFALFDHSKRLVSVLRNSQLQTILCETEKIRHFIYEVPYGVFSLTVERESQKLGLMRLLLKHYIEEMRRVLGSVSFTVPGDVREAVTKFDSSGSFMLTRLTPSVDEEADR